MEKMSRKDELACMVCALAGDVNFDADRFVDVLDKYEREVRKEVFEHFDKYACIKDDKWYKDLKEQFT